MKVIQERPKSKEKPLSTLSKPPVAGDGADGRGSKPPQRRGEASSQARARMPTVADAAMIKLRDLKFSGGLTPKLFGRPEILDYETTANNTYDTTQTSRRVRITPSNATTKRSNTQF